MRLNIDQHALLNSLDEKHPMMTGEAVRLSGAYRSFSSNQASAFAHQDLIAMKNRGLVVRLENAKPIHWKRTAVGSDFLKANGPKTVERNPR